MIIIKPRLEQSFPCRPEADQGADPMAAIATAVQPGNWHRPNTEDEEDSEDFTQSAHANVAIESIYINKEHFNDVLEEESVDAQLQERGQVVDKDAGDLIGTPHPSKEMLLRGEAR